MCIIDAEHALDVLYAKNLGVDVENLLVSQPDFGEQALDILETLARSGAVNCNCYRFCCSTYTKS